MSKENHISATPGESISEHRSKGGPVAAFVDDVEPGEETVSVQVKASDLLDAITTDLGDSYDDVYLYTDGERIVVTDHREPAAGAECGTIDEFDHAVVRTEVIEPTGTLAKNMVDREHAEAALEVFGDSVVTVYLDDYYPIVIENETKAVGIAPRGKPDEFPDGVGRKPA